MTRDVPFGSRRPRNLSKKSGVRVAALALVVCSVVPAAAFETDQYLAAEAQLEDSAGAVNEFINTEARVVLERVNRRGAEEISCEELPPKIYRRLFKNLFASRLRHFVKTSDRIDRFPRDDVGSLEYTRESIYRKPAFPFVVPLSRTIRLGDVHFGIDKFGHLFGFGRRYYARYRSHLRSGLSEEEALARVVGWGLMMERFFVGGWADGVFSYADLEANYQGLALARDLCEAPRPHLELVEGRWRLARPIELERYVNQDFDESINNNHFLGHRWRQVRPMLLERYCGPARPSARAARPATLSFSARYVSAHFESKGHDRQRLHSLAGVCSLAEPAPEMAAR